MGNLLTSLILNTRKVVLERDVAEEVHEIEGDKGQGEEVSRKLVNHGNAVDVPMTGICKTNEMKINKETNIYLLRLHP